MAKIEMDLSEYKIMEENKVLLEKSLKNEKVLQEQIKKLSEEKIKVLEDAKMKVVKVKKSEITNHLLQKQPSEYTWRELYSILGIYQQQIPTINTDRLANIFFQKITTYSTPIEEITTHNLDDIKIEIRNDLEAKMDDDIKIKIKQAENALIINNKLINENKTLLTDKDFLVNKNTNLQSINNELIKDLDDINNNNNNIISTLREILKNGYGFWNKSELLDKIIKSIKI